MNMETKMAGNEKQKQKPKQTTGLRVRTQVRVGGNELRAGCNICKDNCIGKSDDYDCLSECDLIC